jgi:hypothetical protein
MMVMAATAVATLVVGGLWPSAEATPSRARQLETLLTSAAGASRKAVAVEDLRKLDSTEARAKLAALADSKDERLALLAIRALGRSSASGAQCKVEQVFEDAKRSVLVREVALGAWCVRQAKENRAWADCEAWVKEKAGGDQKLKDMAAALKSKLWKAGGR